MSGFSMIIQTNSDVPWFEVVIVGNLQVNFNTSLKSDGRSTC